ncbi:class I adenylate-forming enzyme family protein [Streptomyces sp. NPDC004752]
MTTTARVASADDSPRDLVEEVEQQARQRPDAIALIDGLSTLTYQQMWAGIEARARSLRRAGVAPGDRIALVAENSADFLVFTLAIWHAGGVLVTIYPSTTVPDLAYCLTNSDPVLVLTDARTRQKVEEAAPELPLASISDYEPDIPPTRQDTLPNPDTDRGRLGLICFTSGTTSRPKAVMVSHEALHNGAMTYSAMWHLGPSDRTVVALPMAWLYGLDTTAMATLVRGGSVIALRRARPDVLVEAISTHGATFLPGVTTMFVKLVNYLDEATDTPDLTSLRFCLSAGEPRNERAFLRWATHTGLPVFDNYSASECFPLVTYDPIKNPKPRPGAAGVVAPNSELKVVDSNGKEVAAGEIGEAWGRGPGVMLGYWRNEEQTRAVLTDDNWYRTSDLVRVDEAGYVHVVGRLSDMIIRGGSNVSPAEVERTLRLHPDIADACVVALPDDIYGQEVVAAIVISGNAPLGLADALQFCRDNLPAYKVPSRAMILDELPLSATTGKVDRRRVSDLLRHGSIAAG